MKTKKQIIRSLDKTFARTAEQFFREAQSNIDTNKYKELIYSKVDKIEAWKIKEKTGLNIEGYAHKITNMDIRHIYKVHGNQKIEARRGQVAVTEKDILLIPEITKNYDSIKCDDRNIKFSENKPVLIYRKKIENEYYYLETVGGKGNKDLRPKTMYIKNNG